MRIAASYAASPLVGRRVEPVQHDAAQCRSSLASERGRLRPRDAHGTGRPAPAGVWQYRVAMLRKLAIGLLLLLVLAAGAVVLVARGAVGNDALRTALEQQLSTAVKQPVRIARLGASFYPRVAIDLHDVTIGEPAGATITELSVATGLRGLLSRRVEEAEVIVSNSRIPVSVAAGITGAVTSAPPAAPGSGITLVSVRTLAFRHVELITGAQSLLVDFESSLAGDCLDVTRLTAQSAGTHLEARGALTSIGRRQGRFTAAASRLEFDELLALASALSTSSAAATATAASAAPGNPPLDLTIELSAPGGTAGGYAFTALTSTLHITPAELQLQPLRFGVFGGTYDGRITAATARAVPDVGVEGRIAGIDILTLLRETRGTSSLSGKLSGSIALTTRGTTGDAMLAAARGTGRVTIANGVIPGLEMVRTVVLAFGKPSGTPPAGAGSAFEKIDAAFSLANRTLHSDDLSFTSRDFDMAGAPTIHLPEGGIDMRTSVRLSRELTAQAGTDLRRYAQEDGRVVVPAIISGTVAAPSVMVDVKAVVSRALENEIKRRVQGLFDRLIKK